MQESEDKYPSYAKIAREEGFESIAEWFEVICDLIILQGLNTFFLINRVWQLQKLDMQESSKENQKN